VKYALLIGLALCGLTNSYVDAKPYYPKMDSEILEQLPAHGESWFEIRALKKRVESNPNDLSQTLQLVRRYIELGRAESDPRYYGYAEAALTPWMQTTHPNAETLTLRATLFQNRHEFPAALEHLNKALAQQPRLAQAWLTRALIQEVQGNYAAALNSCLPLIKLASPLTAKVCITSTLSLSGQIDSAYHQLNQAIQTAEHEQPQDKQWALITLAEMAERIGNDAAAEQHYREAFDLNLRSGYLLATYADFLMDHKRYNEVITLLQKETRADGLLLRLTIAEQRLNLAELTSHKETLAARFAASRMRGDTSHQGDEARFLLHVLQQPEQALELALQNWSVQRESRDARILLEATLAFGKAKQAAQPTLDFLAQSRLQDARLKPLIDQFKGTSS
jgi:tetratricopeptide (TPR) repeat protein